jgi:hypothetical protein
LDFKLKMKKKMILKKRISEEGEGEEEAEVAEEEVPKSPIKMKLKTLKEWISVIISIIDISLFFRTKKENRRSTKNIEIKMIKKETEGIIEAEEEEEGGEEEAIEEVEIVKLKQRMKNGKIKKMKTFKKITQQIKHSNKQKVFKIN